MNCPEAQMVLQEQLDGEPFEERQALTLHLLDCAACRDLFAAVPLLEKGLRQHPPPAPPALLADRIVAEVLAGYRIGQRRRLLTTVALAASLLVAILVVYEGKRSPPQSVGVGPVVADGKKLGPISESTRPEKSSQPVPVPEGPVARQDSLPSRPSPSLNQSVAEAGSALAGLTRRTADATVGQTRRLLPDTVPTPSQPGSETLQISLDPPVRSLAEAGQGVSAGLEPVTNSARRAVDLFLNELPPLETTKKHAW